MPFGGKGAVIAEFSETPKDGEIVHLKRYKRFKFGT
jgi:hypothetical protein